MQTRSPAGAPMRHGLSHRASGSPSSAGPSLLPAVASLLALGGLVLGLSTAGEAWPQVPAAVAAAVAGAGSDERPASQAPDGQQDAVLAESQGAVARLVLNLRRSDPQRAVSPSRGLAPQ